MISGIFPGIESIGTKLGSATQLLEGSYLPKSKILVLVEKIKARSWNWCIVKTYWNWWFTAQSYLISPGPMQLHQLSTHCFLQESYLKVTFRSLTPEQVSAALMGPLRLAPATLLAHIWVDLDRCVAFCNSLKTYNCIIMYTHVCVCVCVIK